MNNANYYIWLVEKIDDGGADQYDKLLHYLFNETFKSKIKMDINRINDALNLRNDYMSDTLEDYETTIGTTQDDASVLEVLIALSERLNDLTYDIVYGNRTAEWFWQMIFTMGIGYYKDDSFDIYDVHKIVKRFLDRKYSPDGSGGGIFIIRDYNIDMRTTELWYQMQFWLDEYYVI